MCTVLTEVRRKHGTFRPKLLSLVQSNDADTVLDTTTNAFEVISSTGGVSSPLPALKVLTQLRGIGPATASLLLSVLRPEDMPFFSDELFRWCCWNEGADAKGGGWKRGIKYNVKEYGIVVEGVGKLRKRLGVSAVDVERVAWVLGKEGVHIEAGDGHVGEEEAEEDEEDEVVNAKPVAKKRKIEAEAAPPKKASKTTSKPKAKAKEISPPRTGTRKSARTNK